MSSPDPGRSRELAATLGLLLALCSIVMPLRIYCRWVIVKSSGWDDVAALITYVLFVAFVTCGFQAIVYGAGQKSADIPPENYQIGIKWWWSCEIIYVATNMALKISIIIFLLRLAASRTHRFILWVAIVIVEIYSLYFLLVFIFQCSPISYFWSRYADGHGKCLSPSFVVGSFYGYSVLSCITDWTFSVLPIFMTWNLNMDIKQKAIVWIILAFAGLASTATIVRFPYLSELMDLQEFLYSATDVAIWSPVETGLGIFASNAATLRPLYRNMFGTYKSKHSNDGKGYAPQNYPQTPSRAHFSRHGNGMLDEENYIQLPEASVRFGHVTTTIVGSGGSVPHHESPHHESQHGESNSTVAVSHMAVRDGATVDRNDDDDSSFYMDCERAIRRV